MLSVIGQNARFIWEDNMGRFGDGMAPASDGKRTSPEKVTDFERTGMAQGQGYPVVRIETVEGSRQAAVTWRDQPQPDSVALLEAALRPFYDRFSHGI